MPWPSSSHAHLNASVPPAAWARALDVPWSVDRPNAGFMLVAGDAVVGVQLAFYSERIVDGRAERFCNLGAWCVLEEHRFHAMRLLKALLAQDGYHFTDLSPSGNVVGVNERLGFRFLDTTTVLMPNLPVRRARPGQLRSQRDRAARSAATSSSSTATMRAPPPRGTSCSSAAPSTAT